MVYVTLDISKQKGSIRMGTKLRKVEKRLAKRIAMYDAGHKANEKKPGSNKK